MLNKLTSELRQAEQDRIAAGNEATMQLASVEIEFQFTVEEINNTTGGIDIKVIDVAKAKNISENSVQRVTLTLTALSESAEQSKAPLGTRYLKK